MYDIVEIATNQKVPSADLTAIGRLGRAGQTALTRHVAGDGMSWNDFTFAVSGLTVTVSDGFLYKAGGQYKTVSATPVPLATLTPPSAGLKRVVSIVAFANPARPDAAEQREFAIQVTPATPTTPATYQNETRGTNTRNRQIASVAAVAGDIAPQPTPPVIAADQCEIARVVLLAGSIESVTPIIRNRTPNLTALQLRVDGHDTFIDGVGSRLDTIDKNLSTLSANQPPPTSENTLRQALSNLALLNEMTKAKTGDVAYGYEVGLDMRHTDNTVSGYAATVSDGIRFPWVASKERPLTLYTPGDNAVKIVAGLMLPDFDEETRIAVDGKDGESNISNQVHSVTTAIKRTISRSSVSYGPAFTVCNNTAYWQSGNYNAAAGIFQREGEVFTAAPTGVDFGAPVGYAPGTHIELRLQQQWTDSWTEEYWDYVTETFGIDGTLKGQTFKVPDFGYLTSIELPFTRKDAAFGVTLLLTETVIGQPSIKRVIEKVTLAAADIVADPGGTVRTKFTFRPVLTDPGKLYAWATVTKGNYALATVSGNKFAQGSSFDSTDNGEWFQGSTTIDYAFRANFAKFKATRVEIRMNDIDNVSGNTISALRYLYGSVIPAGGRIIHRVRKEGGAWTTAADVNKVREAPLEIASGPFAANPLPVSVQQLVILVGTQTLMPAIDLNQAWVTALKLGTVLNHFTEPLGLGAPCNRAEVQVTLDGPYIPANHTAGCNLVVGGATVAPTGSSVKIDPDKPGKRVVTYTFTFAAASSFRINLTGTLATILSAYHVDNRFFRAWSV